MDERPSKARREGIQELKEGRVTVKGEAGECNL